jgi:hypothetical protein
VTRRNQVEPLAYINVAETTDVTALQRSDSVMISTLSLVSSSLVLPGGRTARVLRLSSTVAVFGALLTLAQPAFSQSPAPSSEVAAEPAPQPGTAPAAPVASTPASPSPGDAPVGVPPPAQPQASASTEPGPAASDKLFDHWEGGGWLGYGVQLDSEATRPFGVTLGARVGAVVPQRLYLGLVLGVFAGQSSSATYQGVRYTASLWQTQVGVEGGYDLELGPLTLRPYLGIGINHTKVSYSATYVVTSYQEDHNASTDLFLNPGAMAHLELTKRVYAGVDTHLSLVTDSPLRSAFVVAASGGVSFF